MKIIERLFLLAAATLLSSQALAITGVNPTGVNVNHTAPSTVFLTFQNLEAGETSVDAFWCGQVTATGASSFNPCVPGTIFGHLPKRHNLSTSSGIGANKNLTDIMTIPASVVRRAFQNGQAGNDATFFYVRHFTGGTGGDVYVTVTCRMAGGGARSPLALLDVQVGFDVNNGSSPVYLLPRNEIAPSFGATVFYNGTGRLKGRWEVVMTGDVDPSAQDLLTEASLPVEKRGLQRRYTELGRFDLFLPPTGRVFIPGPNTERVPNKVDGLYKILLRIEATSDKEGNSNTLSGVARSGGVAGFPMPVLRYYVGEHDNAESPSYLKKIRLLLPLKHARLNTANTVNFSWVDVPGAALYRLEIENKDGALFSALVNPGVENYSVPYFVMEGVVDNASWRVKALSDQGNTIAKSSWRGLERK